MSADIAGSEITSSDADISLDTTNVIRLNRETTTPYVGEPCLNLIAEIDSPIEGLTASWFCTDGDGDRAMITPETPGYK
ncbi:hypothetical protein, partial [Salmonella sp. s54836]|uniref:hypothetical protein n=1 Tax=Salmonella sp. s54836 TaxID=3159673 RepID=UPI00397F7E40